MTTELGRPEYLSLIFFTFFSILAWLRPLRPANRRNATLLGVAAIGLLVLPALTSTRHTETYFQFLPLLLMPMAYWQTGHFHAPINERFQRALIATDKRFLKTFEGLTVPDWLEKPAHAYLEFAYLLVYPMVPSAVAVLYFAGMMDQAETFWTVVLPPAYACYATLPFLRTLPPRTLERGAAEAAQAGMRGFNLVVVRQVTHQANTFPSGHAAAAGAVALELTRLVPAVGAVYIILAVSIMAAAFVGRYHYALDVVLGAALAVASFLLTHA